MSNDKDKIVQFVLDNTVNLDTNDPLGTKSYSDAIFDIVTSKANNNPMTIGLFGSWGSGKSSIVDTVKERLKDSNEIGVLYYDAWKYSNDAFRRSFILELKNKFKLDMSNDLKTFYQDKTEEVDHNIRFKHKSFFINSLLVVAPIILVAIYIVYKVWIKAINLTDSFYIGLLGVSISLLTYYVKESMIEYKISITKPKIFSPEQFEDVFKEAIYEITQPDNKVVKWFKKIMGKDKYKKVLIIIDNIDRCHKDLSMELLLTIKNFLEIQNCIFLIPIDEAALKEQLGYNNNEGEEFLRKFFNITLRIKKFTTRNLREFTKELIKENGFDFSYKIADIISQEFSRNPRRIKQFLNNLNAEVIVAKFQEANGFITSGLITNNIEFLAKILIIKEEWPRLYKDINDYPEILNIIDECIRSNSYEKKVNSNGAKAYELKESNGVKGLVLSEEQYLFFKRNLNIASENVESFLLLKNLDLDIPGEANNNILRGNWDAIKNMLENKQLTIEKLMDLIYSEYDYAVNKLDGLYETSGFTLLNLLFEIIDDADYGQVFDDEYVRFKNVIDDRRIVNIIPNMNINHLLNCSKQLSKYNENCLRDYIILSISSMKKDNSLVIQYIKTYKDDLQSLNKIKGCILDRIIEDANFINNIINLIETYDVANAIIDDGAIMNIIQKIENSTNEGNKKLIQVIKNLNDLGAVSKQNKERYADKVNTFMVTSDIEIQKFWMNSLKGFFDKFEDKNIKENIYNSLRQNYSNLYNQYSYNSSNIKDNVILLLELLGDYYIKVDLNNEGILSCIIDFMNRNELSEIYIKANDVLYKIIDCFEVYEWSFIDNVYNKIGQLSNELEKNKFLSTLILQLSKVKYINNKYKGITTEQLNKIINITFELFFCNSSAYKDNMLSLMNIKQIKKEIDLKIGTIPNLYQQMKLIEIEKVIDNKDVVQSLITSAMLSTKEYEKLTELITFIKNNVENSNKYLKHSLLSLVRSLENVTNDNESVLRVCLDNEDLFEKGDFASIVYKIEKLLEHESSDYNDIGNEFIKLIMKMPDKKNYTEVNELVNKFKVS